MPCCCSLWKSKCQILPVHLCYDCLPVIERDGDSAAPGVLQVAILYALQNGLLQGMEASSVNVPLRLSIFVQSLRRQHAPMLRQIASSQQLSDEAKETLKHALAEISAVFSS